MSDVYEKTLRACRKLTETQVRGRLRCEKGQLNAGHLTGDARRITMDRVRALEEVLTWKPEKAEKSETVSAFTYRVATKYQNLYDNAKNRGKEFDLNLGDVRRLLTKKRCSYTGVILTDKEYNSPTKDSDRTIDRLDPEKGYVAGNVYAVSHAANTAKDTLFESSSRRVGIGVDETRKMCEVLKVHGFTPQ